jgi:hypothetical protein
LISFNCCSDSKLPSPDIFGKSLYTFYIGQNDFTSQLANIGTGGVQEFLPQVVSQIASTIKVRLTYVFSSYPRSAAKKLIF